MIARYSQPGRDSPELLSPCNDVCSHRGHDGKDVVLFALRQSGAIHGDHQVLDHRVEIGVAEVHAQVRRPHVEPGVGAWSSASLTKLVGELLLEDSDRRAVAADSLEKASDAFVARCVRDEAIDDTINRGHPAKSLVERGLRDYWDGLLDQLGRVSRRSGVSGARIGQNEQGRED